MVTGDIQTIDCQRQVPTSAPLTDESLLSELKRVGRGVRRAAAARLATWRPSIVRPSFIPAAENLASYLALRAHDLRDVQVALSERGLSSLPRAERRRPPDSTRGGLLQPCRVSGQFALLIASPRGRPSETGFHEAGIML
jgi:hypothetical protein